jgi:hypothetical protein
MYNTDGIISLFIACIEVLLVVNLLVFAQKNDLNVKAIILILLLALYQVLEFLICFLGWQSSLMIYLAFADITFLPPLGLLIILQFWNYKSKLYNLIYIPAVFFVLFYLFVINKFAVTKCTVLYATYNYPLGDAYGLFYYLPIVALIILLILKIKAGVDKDKIRLSKIILSGYFFLTIPIIIGVMISFSFTDLIESIMCKLGFIVALCFSYFILKNRHEVERIA